MSSILRARFVRHYNDEQEYPADLDDQISMQHWPRAFALRGSNLILKDGVVQRPVSAGINPVANENTLHA